MIELKNIHIEYNQIILNKEDITIPESRLTLIMGKSGSGKSTLLYRIGLISKLGDSEYIWNKEIVSCLKDYQKASIRRYQIGYVFQDYNLYDHLNVYDHLAHYARIVGLEMNQDIAKSILKKVKLHISLQQAVQTISGGEKQRLAIACALVKQPAMLILDEPTSFLDQENEKLIFHILKDLTEEGVTVVCASHSENSIEYADKIYCIENKKIELVKDCTDNHGNSFHQIIKKPFIFYYIQNFIKKYKWIQLSMIMVMILGISDFLYINEKNYQSHVSMNEEINSSIDNELLINNVSNQYLEKLQSLDYIKKIYPFYNIQMNNNGEIIPIYPLFKENNLGNSIEQNYSLASQRHFYINYQSAKENIASFEYGQFVREIKLFSETEIKTLKTDIEVSGILKEGIATGFTDSSRYAYLNNDDIDNILNNNRLKMKTDSYVIFTKDIYSYKQLCNLLTKDLQDFNDKFQETDSLINILDTTQQTMKFQDYWIFIISVGLLSLLSGHYFLKRKKEFAIVYANGLNRLNIFKLIIVELGIRILMADIIILIGIVLLDRNGYLIQNLTVYFNSVLLLSGIIFLAPSLVQGLMLIKLDVETIIRK